MDNIHAEPAMYRPDESTLPLKKDQQRGTLPLRHSATKVQQLPKATDEKPTQPTRSGDSSIGLDGAYDSEPCEFSEWPEETQREVTASAKVSQSPKVPEETPRPAARSGSEVIDRDGAYDSKPSAYREIAKETPPRAAATSEVQHLPTAPEDRSRRATRSGDRSIGLDGAYDSDPSECSESSNYSEIPKEPARPASASGALQINLDDEGSHVAASIEGVKRRDSIAIDATGLHDASDGETSEGGTSFNPLDLMEDSPRVDDGAMRLWAMRRSTDGIVEEELPRILDDTYRRRSVAIDVTGWHSSPDAESSGSSGVQAELATAMYADSMDDGHMADDSQNGDSDISTDPFSPVEASSSIKGKGNEVQKPHADRRVAIGPTAFQHSSGGGRLGMLGIRWTSDDVPEHAVVSTDEEHPVYQEATRLMKAATGKGKEIALDESEGRPMKGKGKGKQIEENGSDVSSLDLSDEKPKAKRPIKPNFKIGPSELPSTAPSSSQPVAGDFVHDSSGRVWQLDDLQHGVRRPSSMVAAELDNEAAAAAADSNPVHATKVGKKVLSMVTPAVDKNEAIAQWFNRSSPEPEKADSQLEDAICSDSDGGVDVDSEASIEATPMRQIVKRTGNKKNLAKHTKKIERQSRSRADDESNDHQEQLDSQRAEEMRQFLELGI
jgi:hypothetical protein